MANTLKFGNGEWYGKKDTILAYNDLNSNYKPLPFNFSRASSATRVNKAGLIETVGSGQPRVDYKDDAKGALLLEPSRTNILPYSEDFSNSNWINQSTDTTLSLVSSGSPDGGAFYRCTSGSNGGGRIVDVFSGSLTGGVFSIYAKGSGSLRIDLFINGGGNINDTITLTSEWKKYEVYNPQTNSSGDVSIRFFANSVADIFGAQVESGSYATSYIPTSGSAVTRLSELNPFERTDLVSKNLVGDTEMTWFLDAYIFNRNSTTVSPKIENNSNGNIFIGLNVTNDTSLNIRHKDGTTASNTSSISFTNGQRTKVAIRIIGTSATAFINGVKVGDFTSSSIDSFDVFSSANGNPYNINDLRFYNTALTDQELIALTS